MVMLSNQDRRSRQSFCSSPSHLSTITFFPPLTVIVFYIKDVLLHNCDTIVHASRICFRPRAANTEHTAGRSQPILTPTGFQLNGYGLHKTKVL